MGTAVQVLITFSMKTQDLSNLPSQRVLDYPDQIWFKEPSRCRLAAPSQRAVAAVYSNYDRRQHVHIAL